MNESVPIAPERPSFVGSFFKGALSSAFNGAMMMGLLFAVSFIPGLAVLAPQMIIASGMVLATGLFGGVMGVKRAMFDAPHASVDSSTFIPVPVSVSSPAVSVPAISADMASEQDQPSKNWVAETGGERDAQRRIQNIIANGSMSDKDRASAILAAREAASTADTGRNA